MTKLQVHLFKDSYEPFTELLAQNNIDFKERKLPFKVMASSSIIEIIADASLWGALAIVLIAWIKSKAGRTVIVTTEDNQVVHIQGYSAKQVEKILESAKDATVLDAIKQNSNSS